MQICEAILYLQTVGVILRRLRGLNIFQIRKKGRVEMMKRKATLLLAAAMLLSAFAGCGESKAAAPNASGTGTKASQASQAETGTRVSQAAELPEPEEKVPEAYYLAETALPAEGGEGGTGVGNAWKSNVSLCQAFEELHGFAEAFPTKGPDKITSLPIYRETFIPGETAVTPEIKTGLKTTAEEFLALAGREDLVNTGLTPNQEFYDDPMNPAFECQFEDFTLMVMPDAVSLMLEVPGLRDADEDEFWDMIQENSLISAACQWANIDDPKTSYHKDYTYSGDPNRKAFRLYQNSEDGKELIKNKTFRSLFLSAGYETDAVVVRLTCSEAGEYAGDYKLLPYNKALNALRQEMGIQNKDVLGYEIQYTNHISKGYYVPYYVFYYEDRGAGGVAPEELEAKGLSAFCEYCIRAVQDNQAPAEEEEPNSSEIEESPSSEEPVESVPSSELEGNTSAVEEEPQPGENPDWQEPEEEHAISE